MLLDKLGGLPF